MLLNFTILPILIVLLILFFHKNNIRSRWRALESFLLLFILIRIVPLNTSLFSLCLFVRFISATLWVITILKRFVPYNMSHTYYLPSRVPYPLIPVLYLLEIVSELVRPLALTVRIVVNLSLRHLFIHRTARPAFRVILPLILIFEIVVARIQTYIYTVLPSLW